MKKNKKVKFIILFCILLIVVILFSLILISKKKENKNQEEELKKTEQAKEEYVIVQDKEKTFKILNCVSKYFETINKNNSTYFGTDKSGKSIKVVEEKDIKKKIYNLLSEDYIKENNITEENVYSYVQDLEDSVNLVPLKMEVLKKENIEKYIVYGFVEKSDYTYIADIYLIINYDIQKNTFSVEPIKNGITDIAELEKYEFSTNSIENNTVNKVIDIDVNDEYVSGKYLYIYKQAILSKPEYAYNLLDKEYREKRFENLENFKKYIENNKESIKTIVLDKYLVNEEKNQYVCKDKNDNTYVFNLKNGVLDYTIQLDTYTIETEEYKNTYNEASNVEKAKATVEKFVYMVNNRDYLNLYKLLDEEYKNNYFKTEDDFEKYMKKYFPYYYEYDIEKTDQQGDIYVFAVNMKNKEYIEYTIYQFNIMVKVLTDGSVTISFNYIK